MSSAQTLVFESNQTLKSNVKTGDITEIEENKTVVIDLIKKRILISPVPSFGNLTITNFKDGTTPAKQKYVLYNFRCIDDNTFDCTATLLFIEGEKKNIFRVVYQDYEFFYFLSKEIR